MDLFGRKAQKALALTILDSRQKSLELSEALRRERNLQDLIVDLRIECARYEERLKPFEQTGSPKRLYKSEEEEEAEFAYEQGHIDYDEYERVLRKAGFENTNVELAPEVSDIVY